MSWWAVLFVAHAAQDCAEPFSVADVERSQKAALDALFHEDLDGFRSAHRTLAVGVPCLDTLVPAEVWGPHLINIALYGYAFNEGDWRSPLFSAALAWPTLDFGELGPSHPFRIAVLQPPPAQHLERVPPDGVLSVYLDGRRVSYLPDEPGTHLLQVQDEAGAIYSVLIDERSPWAVFRERYTPPTEAALPAAEEAVQERARRPLLRVGAGLVVGGGITAGTTAMIAFSRPGEWSEGQETALTVGNTAGFVAVGLGLSVGTVGLLREPTVTAGPNRVQLRWSF